MIGSQKVCARSFQHLVIDNMKAVVDDAVKVLSKCMVAHAGRPKGVAGDVHIQVGLVRHILQVVGCQCSQSASQAMPCNSASWVNHYARQHTFLPQIWTIYSDHNVIDTLSMSDNGVSGQACHGYRQNKHLACWHGCTSISGHGLCQPACHTSQAGHAQHWHQAQGVGGVP